MSAVDDIDQIPLATSMLKRLSLPNVLCNDKIKWHIDPTKGGISSHKDVKTFTIANKCQELSNLPLVEPGQGKTLRQPGGGGNFSLNRGEGILTLERQRELSSVLDDIMSIDRYKVLASTLPQDTLIHYYRQDQKPDGWDNVANCPEWPDGGGILLKVKLPSTYQNYREDSNRQRVAMFLSDEPSDHNGFTGTLKRLFAYWCSCKKGWRSNSTCSHVSPRISTRIKCQTKMAAMDISLRILVLKT